jgi:hypothetical protein
LSSASIEAPFVAKLSSFARFLTDHEPVWFATTTRQVCELSLNRREFGHRAGHGHMTANSAADHAGVRGSESTSVYKCRTGRFAPSCYPPEVADLLGSGEWIFNSDIRTTSVNEAVETSAL